MPEAPPSSGPNLIEVHGLTRVHGTGPAAVRALDGLDLVVRRGGFVAVVGVSGSGKSSLLHLLGCLDTPTAGSIRAISFFSIFCGGSPVVSGLVNQGRPQSTSRRSARGWHCPPG